MTTKQADTIFDRPLWSDWLVWWAGLLAAGAVASTYTYDYAGADPNSYQLTAFVIDAAVRSAFYVGFFAGIPGAIRRRVRRTRQVRSNPQIRQRHQPLRQAGAASHLPTRRTRMDDTEARRRSGNDAEVLEAQTSKARSRKYGIGEEPVVSSIRASHVVIAQIGEVDGTPVHMNSVDGRDVLVALEGDSFVVEGGGLSESYGLGDVGRVEVTPDGSRFGLMAPGEVGGLLVPQPGMHMVRIDAKRSGKPKRSDLRAFGEAVSAAVERARRIG